MQDRSRFRDMRNERIMYVVIWGVVVLFPVLLELWSFVEGSEFKWHFVFRWWLSMLPLVAIFLLHEHVLIPKLLKTGRWTAYILSWLTMIAVYGGCQYVSDRYWERDMMERPRLPHSHDFRFEQDDHHHVPMECRPDFPPKKHPPRLRPPHRFFFMLLLAVLMLGLNVILSLVFTYRREKEKMQELENSRLHEELKYLKQQISPHFLMNVLNNIHEMTEEDPKEAQDMILELSHLMRYVLYESEKPTTTLASECCFISSYIALMRRRYVEDIVNVTVEMPDRLSDNIYVPPLLFISFIENAFKHGVSYNSRTSIDINLYCMEDKIVFRCENSLPADSTNAVLSGLGLNNVRRRLDLLYDKEYILDIHRDNRKYSVTLIIPIR